MSIQIWIDADSCPTLVRNYVVSYAKKLEIPVLFVANKHIPAQTNDFKMIICPQEKDAADNIIFDQAQHNDLVITRDIILASRLVEKGITTINDRGFSFTKDNIKEKVSERDFDLQLAQIGLGGQKGSTYNKKQLAKFANCFDKEIQSKLRKEKLLHQTQKNNK